MPMCQARRAVAVFFAATICAAPVGAEPAKLAVETQSMMPEVDRFVAADAFKVGARIGGRTVWLLGFDFASKMLPVIETNVHAVPVQAWTLRYSADDATLIKSVGGETNAVLPLAAIHYVMTLDGKGGNRVDWRSNFAYVRLAGEERLLAVHWFVNQDGEWVIGAAQVPHPAIDWSAGSRLFSRAPAPVGGDQLQIGTVLKH